MSSLTWLDFSERDRRKALDVIDLFREKGTVDELGIGTIRDAFADLLFPGTSTIQTRTRYFFFVPWIYQRLEAKRVPSAEIARRARADEIKLVSALEAGGERRGVIGIDARERLKRLPSEIYWQGLGRLGIRLYPGAREQYHRYFDRYYRHTDRHLVTDDGDPAHGSRAVNWHPAVPTAPDGLLDQTTFELTHAEAEYLRDRIMHRAPGTLLAFLVHHGRPAERVDFPWIHPQYGMFPPRLKEQLDHARCFSEAIHGAPLLYNLMLAELVSHRERIDQYRADLEEWAGLLQSGAQQFASWDRARFWQIVLGTGARVSPPTRLFVDSWLDLAVDGDPTKLADSRHARDLVHQRERMLKRGQARLDNRRALEMWGGAAGIDQLDYRWGMGQQVVSDILGSLGS